LGESGEKAEIDSISTLDARIFSCCHSRESGNPGSSDFLFLKALMDSRFKHSGMTKNKSEIKFSNRI
jgi:hypothetical protein